MLAWFRQLAAQQYDSSEVRKKAGRPREANELRALVIRLANENLTWGYTKIRDALRGLKIEMSRPVRDLRGASSAPPAPGSRRPLPW
jgi:putative transposase